MIKMESTYKYFFNTEEEAELFVEKMKKEDEGVVIDYKISNKETKAAIFTILTIKIRYKTLAEAKDS